MLDVIDLDYPESTWHLPLLNVEGTVRCFTVGETTAIRTSNTFGITMLNSVNELIYNCLVQKPDMFSDFNQFKKNLPTKDRDALLYSILEASDELKQTLPMECIRCGNVDQIEVNIQDCFDAILYDGEPGAILNETDIHVMETPKVVVTFELKVPTIERERKVLLSVKNLQKMDPLLLSSLYTVNKISFTDKRDNKDLGTIDSDNFESLHIFLRRLRLRQLKDLDKAYVDGLGKYGISLKYTHQCTQCGNVMRDNPVDLTQCFFQAIV